MAFPFDSASALLMLTRRLVHWYQAGLVTMYGGPGWFQVSSDRWELIADELDPQHRRFGTFSLPEWKLDSRNKSACVLSSILASAQEAV